MCQLPFMRMCVRRIRSPEKVHEQVLAARLDAFDRAPDDRRVDVHPFELGEHGLKSHDRLASEGAVQRTRRAKDRVAFGHGFTLRAPDYRLQKAPMHPGTALLSAFL